MCAKAPTYSTPHKSFHSIRLEWLPMFLEHSKSGFHSGCDLYSLVAFHLDPITQHPNFHHLCIWLTVFLEHSKCSLHSRCESFEGVCILVPVVRVGKRCSSNHDAPAYFTGSFVVFTQRFHRASAAHFRVKFTNPFPCRSIQAKAFKF
jgi:hypothetical protein